MRKVTIVVPVLITSCHVSEKPNNGPVTTQSRMTRHAVKNAQGRPVKSAILDAVRENSWLKPPCGSFSPTASWRFWRWLAFTPLKGANPVPPTLTWQLLRPFLEIRPRIAVGDVLLERADREAARVEPRRDLVPREWHGDGRSRTAAHRVRRDDRLQI
jgi:hypothetical protein